MTTSNPSPNEPRASRCSFCKKPKDEVNRLIGGPGVYICDACVALCVDVLATEQRGEVDPSVPKKHGQMPDHLVLAALPNVAATVHQVENELAISVHQLREHGVSWDQIGEALGVTAAAAADRWSRQ